MTGEVHILVNCPITTFLMEKQHSAMSTVTAMTTMIRKTTVTTETAIQISRQRTIG